LKKEYGFKINNVAFQWFVEHTDTLIIQGLKKYSRTDMPLINLYSFANQHFTTTDFAKFIENRGPMIITKDSLDFINTSIETRSADHLISYENSVLEKKYPEFRYLINEFHDGILLFDISGKKIWNRVNEDSAGLHHYYEEHKNKYVTRMGIEAKIYTLKSDQSKKSLESAFRKYSRKAGTDNLLINHFNRKNDTLLIIKEGRWFKGDDPELDKLQWNTGSQSFTKEGSPSIILINKVVEPVPIKYEEIRGEMMTGYQEQLESEWAKQLMEKYNVKVDTLVLEAIRKKLHNE
jgi:peptidyl-prolyl cis-trans isomerase SurA